MTKEEMASIARIEEKIDNVSKKVDDINTRLYGNGHAGIIVDQERQNAQLDKLIAIADKNSANIDKLFSSSLPSWLSKNWIRVLIIAALFFVIIHSILPADMSIWQLIAAIR